MRKARKMRRLSIDVTTFLTDYNDALSAGLTVAEFCELQGFSVASLHGRLVRLFRRGVAMPLLPGMKRRSKLGRALGLVPKQSAPVHPAPMAEAELVPVSHTFQIVVGAGA